MLKCESILIVGVQYRCNSTSCKLYLMTHPSLFFHKTPHIQQTFVTSSKLLHLATSPVGLPCPSRTLLTHPTTNQISSLGGFAVLH